MLFVSTNSRQRNILLNPIHKTRICLTDCIVIIAERVRVFWVTGDLIRRDGECFLERLQVGQSREKLFLLQLPQNFFDCFVDDRLVRRVSHGVLRLPFLSPFRARFGVRRMMPERRNGLSAGECKNRCSAVTLPSVGFSLSHRIPVRECSKRNVALLCRGTTGRRIDSRNSGKAVVQSARKADGVWCRVY